MDKGKRAGETQADSSVELRLDARRNREKILSAAHVAFADPDADVSMAEIARRAGIGSATLYRNFPNRRALLETLYTDEIDAICHAATTVVGDSPLSRFVAWLREFYEYFTNKRVLAGELLEHTDGDDPVFNTGFARIMAAATPLFTAARKSGELRTDLDLEQVLALVTSIANIPGEAAYRRPLLEVALDGLRTPPPTPGRRRRTPT